MPNAINEALLNQVIELCRQAGDAIMEVYESSEGIEVKTKADDSPLTKADLAAHAILEPALAKLLDGAPVLSEEGEIPDFKVRKKWQQYWIIDPLDGTKEFIKRSGEFTVNVAFISDGKPILGVVYVPVTGVTYAGGSTLGAFKIDDGNTHPIKVRSIASCRQQSIPVSIVASRNHGAEAVTTLLNNISKQLGPATTTNMGSSLKLCLIAEGVADLYPRLAPTCEWDTAAAQAVVEAAGGIVLDDQMNILRYNQKDSLLNPYFYVIGDKDFDWPGLLKN
jgi:3'(2'), 5'-bisphosphate nucleotidase